MKVESVEAQSNCYQFDPRGTYWPCLTKGEGCEKETGWADWRDCYYEGQNCPEASSQPVEEPTVEVTKHEEHEEGSWGAYLQCQENFARENGLKGEPKASKFGSPGEFWMDVQTDNQSGSGGVTNGEMKFNFNIDGTFTTQL